MSTPVAIANLKVGDTVSWNHYSVVNPINITEGEIVGFTHGKFLTDSRAVQAAQNHASVYNAIPVGNVIVPNDFTKYEYITVRVVTSMDNTDPQNPIPVYTTYDIGVPWIIPASVSRFFRESIVITLEDFDVSKLDAVLRILRNNVSTKYSYKILSE